MPTRSAASSPVWWGRPRLPSISNRQQARRRKLEFADWDGDGRFDILVNSSNANLLLQVGQRDGQWVFRDAGPLATRNIEGHDVSPATVDFDDDGVPDFLGGAEDGRFYHLKQTRAPKK